MTMMSRRYMNSMLEAPHQGTARQIIFRKYRLQLGIIPAQRDAASRAEMAVWTYKTRVLKDILRSVRTFELSVAQCYRHDRLA